MEERPKESPIKTARYNTLAALFQYPTNGFPDRVEEVKRHFEGDLPAAAAELDPFIDFLGRASLRDMEELFTRSFDVQALTTLDIGYIVFGDDYKRGKLLANLNREHENAGNPLNSELPDHLPNVLRLLPLMTDIEARDDLLEMVVIPGLRKMIEDFEDKEVERRKKVYRKHYKTLIEDSGSDALVYRHPLKMVLSVLETDAGIAGEDPDAMTGFLSPLDQEMTIEKN